MQVSENTWKDKIFIELDVFHPFNNRYRLLNLSETVPALFSTSAPFSKALKVTCIGGKSWMKVA
jgi:type II secretory pathway component PulF